MNDNITFQENWHDISHILQKYLLNTSVPLIFSDILQTPEIFGNVIFAERLAAEQSEAPNSPQDKESNPSSSETKLHYNHLETWEYLMKEGLIDAFCHRLFGTQADIDTYRARAISYGEVFQDIFGALENGSELNTLISNFLGLMRDYLLWNLPNIPSESETPSVYKLMVHCRNEYKARRFCYNKEENVLHPYYIPFEERTYTFALISQTDELANGSVDSKFDHYLIMAELIHTLFVYVYMVEYIKLNPLIKGQCMETMSPAMIQGRSCNLFSYLRNAKYGYTYDYLQLLKQQNKKK